MGICGQNMMGECEHDGGEHTECGEAAVLLESYDRVRVAEC